MKLKIILISICSLILITGCSSTKETDALKFKKEFEKYNDTKVKLDIDKDNIIKYATVDEINKIIEKKTGVIFIGNPKDNLSRVAINILLQAADSTDLKTIYYISNLDNIKGLDNIENKKTPLVVNVLKGEIISTHSGTINNKTKLSSDEEMELYNNYTDGIHSVLEDACDERC
jgi:hypothetical protein